MLKTRETKFKVVNAEAAQNILLGCGILPDKLGYNYLLTAIDLFRGPTHTMMELYKQVGDIFQVSSASVERCIRTCIYYAFYNKSFLYLNNFFKNDIFKRDTYLSNGGFISLIATYLDTIEAPKIKLVPTYD